MSESEVDMYCSEQIAIPPTFPYLLRQYAKAAIRTQPTDLLKWSTTYFRCLSLNCPPPVKLRLEYPMPIDWHGLTPGWIKSLYLQIHPSSTVEFKILWDRWIGSCLQHENLIQILCLGGFTNPQAIPWNIFIGLCASFITKNLTETMITICEILTEEPEGGSAMISIEAFMSLYIYLARIDASKERVIRNKYFPDNFLKYFKEKEKKFEAAKVAQEEEESLKICEEPVICETVEEVVAVKGIDQEVSCPSIKEDDYQNIEDYLSQQEKERNMEEDEEGSNVSTIDSETNANKPMEGAKGPLEDTQDTETQDEKDKKRRAELKTDERQAIADMDEKELAEYEADKLAGKEPKFKRKKKEQVEQQPPDFEEKGLLEDLEKLRILQQEMAGEDDFELEQYKKQLMQQMEKTPSELEAIAHFTSKLREEKVVNIINTEDSDETKSEDTILPPVDDDEKYDKVYIDAVPGIGPTVPKDLVEAVEIYMRGMAKVQHGMVMPRNIKHYDCPPLEEINYTDK